MRSTLKLGPRTRAVKRMHAQRDMERRLRALFETLVSIERTKVELWAERAYAATLEVRHESKGA